MPKPCVYFGEGLNSMMVLRRIILGLVFSAGAALPCVAQDVTIPVTADFYEFALKWNGGQIVSYEGLWGVTYDKAGTILVCGVGKMKDSNSAQATLQWLHGIYITMGDTKILKDVSYFTRIPSNGDFAKATATCRAKKTKAPNGSFSVGMGWPPGSAKF